MKVDHNSPFGSSSERLGALSCQIRIRPGISVGLLPSFQRGDS